VTAVVYRDRESGFYRAVCKADECRQNNAQRNYWRTPHMKQTGADRAAREHNDEAHPRSCRVCGCTDVDCSGCIARTGHPCAWAEPDLCTACAP
jgi:hypothetical protein